MPPKELSTSIRNFLSRYVRSIEQLEILLLFGREPSVWWSPPKVYESILSTPSSVERWLNELVGSGLLEKSSDTPASYRCSTDAGLRAEIAMVEESYRTSPVRVIEAIYKREANAAQSFADAFKLKNTDQKP